jgi:hypothetical protein
MNPLQSHKQLLIAESELNRLNLAANMSAFKRETMTIAAPVRSLATIAASVSAMISGVRAYQCKKIEGARAKPSAIQTALKLAELVSSCWLLFRTLSHEKATIQNCKTKL